MCQLEEKKIVKYTNYFLVYSTIRHIFAVSNNARKTQGRDDAKIETMNTKVTFLDPTQVKIETLNGDTYILGYSDSMNYQIELNMDGYFSKCVAALFDKYYDGSERSIWGPIASGMMAARINIFTWTLLDRDKERERIGNRIKELRKEQKMDAKELAQRTGIDAGNLSKIEQGRFSVGIDILNKIAAALKTKIDFVPKEETKPNLPFKPKNENKESRQQEDNPQGEPDAEKKASED